MNRRKNMARTVRMMDIAEKVGVSVVSVYKALNGQRGVSEETRQTILKTAEEMGYDTSLAGKTKSSRISYNLGIIVPAWAFDHNSFYAELQQHVMLEASKLKCFAMVEVISNEMIEKREAPQFLKNNLVDGIIVLGRISDDYLRFLREEYPNISDMYLDFSVPDPGNDCVISDGYYGAYHITNYIFSMGHKNIAFVGTPLSTSSITDRYLGYRRSMMEHHVEVRKEWVIEDRHMSTGRMDSENLFQIPDPLPDAFFCNCDLAASFMIQKLENRGFSVPEDVSVCGFDHFPVGNTGDHVITTYEVDIPEMARKAVHNLIHKLNREYYRKGTIIVTGKMIAGNTVSKLK